MVGIKIPKQIEDLSFVLLGDEEGKEKIPFETGWQKKIIKKDNPYLKKHLKAGKNYGVATGILSPIKISGRDYYVIGVDFDKAEVQEELLKKLPKTFSVKTGGKGLLHLYFATNQTKSYKILDKLGETLIDVQADRRQLVAPGSFNLKTKRPYEVVEDVPIEFIDYSELKALLMPYDTFPKKPVKIKKEYTPKGISGDLSQEILDSVSMDEVLNEIEIDTTKNPTNCFGHSSVGGKCFLVNEETCKCFHCDKSWNKYSLIRDAKDLTDKETFEWFAEKGGKLKELKQSREEYVKAKKKTELRDTGDIFSRRGQVEAFWIKQPFFYDKSKLFWIWDKENTKWILSDEEDFCNSIFETLGVETIGTKNKSELVNGFKQVGRKHQPKELEKTWFQFKDKIHDVKTGKVIDATPDYFATNPIPFKVGESEDTPTIDKLFIEWVGEDYKTTLEEISAYAMSRDQFMQRIIALVGGGANGKGSYTKFLYKLLGEDNCASSELRALSEDKFETAVIYKKLICVMGEVSYGDLRNTNKIKQMSGEDRLSFQFKGKTPFPDDNTATGFCLTNSLPITPDKSLGFYRRWLIIDFPNQFGKIKENPINKIPNVEFENFCKKVLKILKELYKTNEFTKEGDFKNRMERYEERSNPLMKFIEDHCEEKAEAIIKLRDFTNQLNKYLLIKHLRIMSVQQVGRILREEGFDIGNRKVDNNTTSSKVILNLEITREGIPKIPKIPKSQLEALRKEASSKMGISGISGIPTKEKDKKVNPFCPKCNKFLNLDEKDNYQIKDISYCYDCYPKIIIDTKVKGGTLKNE